MNTEQRNLELKAHDPDPARSENACRRLGARAEGTLRQRDTYFRVKRGYLKLREDLAGGAELIRYERPRSAAARESRYERVPVSPQLAGLLATALDEVAVVAKTRKLYLWQNVRIHLDSVEGLGSFLELEAVASAGSDLGAERDAVDELRRVLEIRDEDLLGESYADLSLGTSS